MPRFLRIESGPGFRLVICVCGWRSMVTTETGVADTGSQHLQMVHGETTRALDFAAKRRRRAQGL